MQLLSTPLTGSSTYFGQQTAFSFLPSQMRNDVSGWFEQLTANGISVLYSLNYKMSADPVVRKFLALSYKFPQLLRRLRQGLRIHTIKYNWNQSAGVFCSSLAHVSRSGVIPLLDNIQGVIFATYQEGLVQKRLAKNLPVITIENILVFTKVQVIIILPSPDYVPLLHSTELKATETIPPSPADDTSLQLL